MSQIISLQQVKKNTYFNQKTTPIGVGISNGQFSFQLPPGLYDIDGSIMNCGLSLTAVSAFDTIYQRSDCFIPCNSSCNITLDDKQIAQYLNLTLAQLEYRQLHIKDWDFIADCADGNIMQSIRAPCTTKKRFKNVGIAQTSNSPVKFNNAFRFRHFFPFIFGENDTHFVVKKMMQITISLGTFDNSTHISYQSTGYEFGTISPSANIYTTVVIGGTVGTNLLPCVETTTNADPIRLTLHMKKAMQNYTDASEVKISKDQHFYVQQVFSGGSNVFNQTLSPNQISNYQSISLIPDGITVAVTQYNFEDVYTPNATGLRVQRQQLSIINAENLSDGKAQALMWKDKNKNDNQNLIIQFCETLSGTDLQTNIICNYVNIQLIVGMQYYQTE